MLQKGQGKIFFVTPGSHFSAHCLMNALAELGFSLLSGKGVEPGQTKHFPAHLTLLILCNSVTCSYTLISVRSWAPINTDFLLGSPYHPRVAGYPRWFL